MCTASPVSRVAAASAVTTAALKSTVLCTLSPRVAAAVAQMVRASSRHVYTFAQLALHRNAQKTPMYIGNCAGVGAYADG